MEAPIYKPIPMKDIPPRRYLTGPIIHADNEVLLRSDPLDAIWWQGRTWAVTAYGIERRDGLYTIPSADLLKDHPRYDWIKHISGKAPEKYDHEEFRTAFLIACALHRVTVPDEIREPIIKGHD
ncbi:hypothetical protein [Paracoccus sp. KR1-242]|uniref:hypothetical protein n=1 Tax=Paracoccus sp. KR1-242 TaxID=3410028 RepID=UPI003C073566